MAIFPDVFSNLYRHYSPLRCCQISWKSVSTFLTLFRNRQPYYYCSLLPGAPAEKNKNALFSERETNIATKLCRPRALGVSEFWAKFERNRCWQFGDNWDNSKNYKPLQRANRWKRGWHFSRFRNDSWASDNLRCLNLPGWIILELLGFEVWNFFRGGPFVNQFERELWKLCTPNLADW